MDEPRSSGGQAGFLIANNPRGRCARRKFLHLAAAALAPLQLIASAEWSLLPNANGPDDNRPTTAALRSIASLDISGPRTRWVSRSAPIGGLESRQRVGHFPPPSFVAAGDGCSPQAASRAAKRE
jgi:hypothetical protein